MQLPSWKDIGFTAQFVKNLKIIDSATLINRIAHEIVFNHKPQTVNTFTCNACGHREKSKTNEDIFSCNYCGKARMSFKSHKAFRKEIGRYIQTDSKNSLYSIIKKVEENYKTYTENFFINIVNLGWLNDYPYCQFLGGELIQHRSPRFCLLKSAILTPVNWALTIKENPHSIVDLIGNLTRNV